MDNQILAALKRATQQELARAIYRQFPMSRANKILGLIKLGYKIETAIEATAPKGK